ncbi:MAG: VOC family protein [Burkholderiaceae bacterium]
MANMHGDFIWYELLTPDAGAAKAFYAGIFGWSLRDPGQPDMDYQIISATEGEVGGLMQLTDEMTAGGARPVWLGYIGVDDVDATVAEIVKAGGTIQMPAMDISNVGRLAMVADPQGAPFYVMRGVHEKTSHACAYDRPRLGHCAWNELATSDRAGAMQFYADTFGWKKDGEMDMGPMGSYEFVRRASVEGMFAGVMTKPQEMPASLWSYYFRVADVDEAVRRTKAGGGQIIVEPMEIPGGEFSVNAVDPQGAMFAFVGPSKP